MRRRKIGIVKFEVIRKLSPYLDCALNHFCQVLFELCLEQLLECCDDDVVDQRADGPAHLQL